MLPTTVRATMHPKPGQIGLAKFGRVFPWNGIAVRRNEGLDQEIEICPLDQAMVSFGELRPICDQNGIIVYYEKATKI
jgi:hypothetical protein